MRAILVSRPGDPDVLQIAEVPRPEPSLGQVLVRLHRIGVNFAGTERGLGLIAVQLARRAGARVLGTVSSESKADAVRSVGGEPFLYGERKLPKRTGCWKGAKWWERWC